MNDPAHEEEFQRIISHMSVPEARKTDYGWLKRNLAIYNQDHPHFRRAQQLLRHLS